MGFGIGSDVNSVVEYLSYHPKAKGLNPATTTGYGRKKIGKKFWQIFSCQKSFFPSSLMLQPISLSAGSL
jgi:hypothetical protein